MVLCSFRTEEAEMFSNRWPDCKLTVSKHLKIGGKPKRKQSSSNHPFSGAKMLVLGNVPDINRITREEIADPTISHHLGPFGFFRIFFVKEF